MSDNLQTAHTRDFALPEHSVLALQGRDSLAFAQAQCMNDVALLDDGQWQWNGWLTPKGRVIALFALLKLDAETLWLLLPDVAAAELAARLQRYVFRSKVTLMVREDLRVSGQLVAATQANGAAFADIDSEIELDFSGDAGPRSLRIGAKTSADDAIAVAQWRRLDLQHGLPRLMPTQAEQWTPQQLSLDRLRAFSVKKGCYPGQEIVARTHYLGQVKRGLALLDADGSVADGASIETEGRGIGSVICVQDDVVLAVLPLARGEPALSVNGVVLHQKPLLGGLAR